MTPADQLKTARAKTGLSQPKAAKLLGVPVGTLRNWEQGRNPPTQYVLAAALATLRDAANDYQKTK